MRYMMLVEYFKKNKILKYYDSWKYILRLKNILNFQSQYNYDLMKLFFSLKLEAYIARGAGSGKHSL